MSDKCPVIFFLLFPLLLCSQSSDRLERTANDLFENGDYGPALEVYLLLHEENPGDPERLARMGVCCFENNQLEDAKGYLDQSIKLSENPSATTYLYLGKLHHSYLDFEGAIANYKLFLKKSSDKNPQRRAVKDDIKRCANGMMVRRKPPLGEVVNIGEPVNSDADECAPLFSPNYEGIIYFAAERKNNAGADSLSYDICFTEKNSGGWVSPMSLDSALNSSKNELPLGFNEKGQALYFFRGNTLFSGDVLVDTFKEDAPGKNTFHVKFDSPAQTWEGDCCLQFFNDSILLFASRRPGGFGGLDIYVATLEPTGWSVPKNLGPTINSAYDDRSPFLAPDGRTLYFSTNDRQRSMGGLDILRSVFLDWAQNWTPPENLGIPFNSAGDEEGFSLSENGVQALFSSSRKTGFGQRDIFLGFFLKNKPNNCNAPTPWLFI